MRGAGMGRTKRPPAFEYASSWWAISSKKFQASQTRQPLGALLGKVVCNARRGENAFAPSYDERAAMQRRLLHVPQHQPCLGEQPLERRDGEVAEVLVVDGVELELVHHLAQI